MSQDYEKGSEPQGDNGASPGGQAETPRTAAHEPESTDAEQSDLSPPGSESSGFEDDSREDLIGKLVSAHNQIEEMKNGYVRAKADVENIRRRSQNEIVAARKYALEKFAQELLGVLDSLDQASKVEMDGASSEPVLRMKEGLELTLKQFATAMEKFGITAVEAAPGVKFDPDLHQAISMAPTDEVEPDHILSVMQQGFLLKDRLLRPAMVVIAQSSGK